MKIYVNFNPPKTIKSFLRKFFSYSPYTANRFYTITHPTYEAGWAVATYRDKECTKTQCTAGRSRSPQDLYNCVKTYYPDATLKEVFAELFKLKIAGKRIWPSYCSTIRRPIIVFSTTKVSTLPQRGGKYGWTTIFNLLDIKTAKDLYKNA